MTDVTIVSLIDPEEFLARWSALYDRAANASFFLSPAWMRAWLEGAPATTQLFAVEACDHNASVLMGVVGCGPRRPAFAGLKEARLHEFAEPASDAVYIEYNDFLAARDGNELWRVKALEALTAEIGADVFVFRNVLEPLASALQAFAAAKGWRAQTLNEQPAYTVELAAVRRAGGDVINHLAGSLSAQVRRALRRYEERGPISVRAAPADEWAGAWRMMTELHAARWKPGVFANDKLTAFHERLRAAAPSACELLRVAAGGDMIGVLYNFIFADRVMNYQSGLRFEDDNQLKPGYVCHALACQHYLERGFDVYDMLAGGAEYKRRLGAQTDTLTSIALERPGLRNAIIKFLRSPRRKPEPPSTDSELVARSVRRDERTDIMSSRSAKTLRT